MCVCVCVCGHVSRGLMCYVTTCRSLPLCPSSGEHSCSHSRSESVEVNINAEISHYEIPRFDSPVGTISTLAGRLYQKPQKETVFGASPPPEGEIHYVHGFNMSETRERK